MRIELLLLLLLFVLVAEVVGPPLCSSSQEFLAADPEVPGSIPNAAGFSEEQ
jgi:hypothetical protein